MRRGGTGGLADDDDVVTGRVDLEPLIVTAAPSLVRNDPGGHVHARVLVVLGVR